jgi:hypothetical protein
VKKLKPRRKGSHHSWTEEEVARFEGRHPVGTRPRPALALLPYGGPRKSNLAHMRPQHIRSEFLQVRQDKADTETRHSGATEPISAEHATAPFAT